MTQSDQGNVQLFRVQACLNVTMNSDGRAHFNSLGSYYGFGWMGNGNLKDAHQKGYAKGYEDGLNKASEILENIGKENKNE